MKEKGFTLIELLAVILILSIISVIATASVVDLVDSSKTKLNTIQITSIKNAAETWGLENYSLLPSSDNCSYITLKDLIDYGLIDSNVLDTNIESIENLKIKIYSYTSKYGKLITEYEVNPKNLTGCSYVY